MNPGESIDGATTWLRAELEVATKKIDNDALAICRLERQVTDLQRRGNELLEEARAARREAAGLRALLNAATITLGTLHEKQTDSEGT
jgi:hypothetical protein